MTTLVSFERSAVLPKLDAQEIHIWHARWGHLAGTPKATLTALSSDERDRADKFRFKEDRDRYATSRAILRNLLGEYLGVSPVKLEFHYGPRGKPYLAENSGPYPIHFNVSHSSELVLLGFSRDQEIGIDLEHIRSDYDFEDIARRFLSPSEVARLISMPRDTKSAEFFRLWTRMEAYAKARGIGLLLLDDVRPSSGRENSAELIFDNRRGEMSNWKIEDFLPAPDYVASVASAFATFALKHWKYS